MRRVLRGLLWLSMAGCAALAAAWAPDAMAELDFFRATDLRVEGTRRLTVAEVVEAADLPPFASVWDDPTPWILSLRRHPLVLEAGVRPDYPRGLVFTVVEREPVALYPTPLLEPVDREGRILPIDPTEDMLDLPLLDPSRGTNAEGRLTPSELRLLTAEAARLREVDPRFLRTISELGIDARGDLVARVVSNGMVFRFRAPISVERLQRGLDALADAMARNPENSPRSVDLRFADQVVISYSEAMHARGQE